MNQNELFLGRLGVNPILKYTKTQKAVCELSVAIKHSEGHVTWRKVIVWNRQAELCPLYLKKGSQVFITASRVIREFRNKKGEVRQHQEYIAQLIGFPNI